MSSWQKVASRQNTNYKRWRRWVAHPEDSRCPWLFLEGATQVAEAAAVREPEMVLASEEHRADIESGVAPAVERVVLPARLFEALSPLRSPQGVGAFFAKPVWSAADLTDCILYADGLQDPGNLGTLIRTAAATGLFSVVTAPGTVSCFNAKVVRATAATLFRVPIRQSLDLETLLGDGYTGWVGEPQAGVSLYDAPFETPLAIVVGNETAGVSGPRAGCRRVHIPMAPGTDSLNAAVAGSLLLFEAYRRIDDKITV